MNMRNATVMRGNTNFKGSDSIDPVYCLFCALAPLDTSTMQVFFLAEGHTVEEGGSCCITYIIQSFQWLMSLFFLISPRKAFPTFLHKL